MSKREDLIALDRARVASIELSIGEESPWHHHTEVVENVVCLQGDICLQFKEPAENIILSSGQRYKIVPMMEHRLVNTGDCVATYLLVQSGSYDFVTEGT